MLDQEKREAEQKTAQSRNIEEQSVEAGKTAAGENGKGAEMQKEEPAEKNDQETSVAASEQEKTGKKRKKKAKQAETAKDLPETVMPPKKRKKKIKKWMIVAAIIVILLVVNIATKLLRPASLPALAGSYAQTGDVEQTLDTSGYVSSEVEETVFSPVTAYVSSSVLEEGQPVTAGEKVVEFDTETLEKAAEQARLTKVASAYGYQDTIQKANKNDQDLANANTSIDILNQQIDDQKSYIADIQNEIKNKQNEAASQAAEQTKPISDRNIEIENKIRELRDQIDHPTETTDTNAINEELSKLYQEKTENDKKLSALTASAGVDTSSQEAKLADAQEQLAKWQADLAEYEGKKSSAEAGQMSGSARAQLSTNQKLESLTASTAAESLEKAKEGITADRNGVVTDVQIVDGSPVSEGAALFKISSLDDVKVDISVTKYNLESIALGQKADITVAGKSYQGTVSKINRIATKNDSGTPVVGSQIHIDNPDAELFLGVEARVSVHMAKSEGVVLVPVEAVNTGTSGSFCWVINSEGVVEKRTVETGVSSSEYTEITSGIASGEYVISDASAEALEGSKAAPAVDGTTAALQ